jgi:hypothetical protein
MPRRLAHVLNGTVTQVSEGSDDDAQHQAWLAAVADQFDRIDDVTDLGYDVNVRDTWTKADGYRPPQPYPSWTWTGTEWSAPAEKPAGEPWEWDESAGEWVRPDGYEPPAE